MIKKIHYCWFGENPIPENTKRYIESFKKFCKGYEIKFWNEKNFDVNSCEFTKKAYNEKKWAFVSDYARAEILYNEGGLFVDTDVEFIKSIDDLMNNSFLSFENNKDVNPGLIMYADKVGMEFFKKVIEKYNKVDFDINNLENITSPAIYTNILKEQGLICNGEKQTVGDFIIYPPEYFQPYGDNWREGKLVITVNTRSIHHYDASWFNKYQMDDLKLRRKYGEFFGRVFFTLKHPIKGIERFKNSENRGYNKEKNK